MSQQLNVRRTENSTPNKSFDFEAWYGDIDLGVARGFGATPESAIAELNELLIWKALREGDLV